MLTPQEVSERAFSKASFGGYNMAQVDEFLDVLTGDYSALFNENAVLKNKMKVLVDKVEEYRSTEEAMRKALMAAQRMADDLVREAERKKDALLSQAEADARGRRAEIERELEAEEFRLKKAQQATAAFVSKVRDLHVKEAEFLSQLEELYPPETQPTVDPVAEKADEIDDNVQRLLAQAMEAATAENLRAKAEEAAQEDLSDTAEFTPVLPPEEDEEEEELPPPRRSRRREPEDDYEDDYEEEEEDCDEEEDEEDDSGRPRGGRIDFGRLQFGRDYEIT